MNEHGFLYRRRKGLTLLSALAISLVLLVVDTGSVSLNPARWGYALFSTVQKGYSGLGLFFRDTVTSIAELRELREEYDAVREKMEDYQVIQRDLVNLREENERLRALLGFTEEIEFIHYPARIVAKEPGTFYNAFTINKGSRHGIRADMPVIAYQAGFQGVVGKVIEAGPASARVLPLISNNCFISSRLQSSRYEGLVQGGGGLSQPVVMRYVVKTAKEEIQFGDLIETSGLDSIYPPGLFIGRVRSIGSREWEPDLELALEPIIDFSRLEYVVVLNVEERLSPSEAQE